MRVGSGIENYKSVFEVVKKKKGNHVSSYVGSLWKIAEYLKSIYEGFKYHNELVHAFLGGIPEVHFKHMVLV